MMAIHDIPRSIEYVPSTRDFDATLDGNFIGAFSTYSAAEAALDRVAYDLLMDGVTLTA